MQRLKKRRQFLDVAKGRRLHTGLFSLQTRERGDEGEPRAGFTVTKKAGYATERNRIRRRFKEAVRLQDGALGAPGRDYVIVARRAALSAGFSELCGEIARAFGKANRPGEARGRHNTSQAPRRLH
jgi:ribonuclease P protein component